VRDAGGQPRRAGGGIEPGEDEVIVEAKVKADKATRRTTNPLCGYPTRRPARRAGT
jgi:hypothetical protein